MDKCRCVAAGVTLLSLTAAAGFAAEVALPTAPTIPTVPTPSGPAKPGTVNGPQSRATSTGALRARLPGGARVQKEEGSQPSSLTIGAFRDELRHTPVEEEKEALKKERLAIDENATALAASREDLRKNTSRLEDLLRKVVAAKGTPVDESSPEWDPALAPKAAAGKAPLDLLSKAMRGMRPEQAAPIVSRLSRPLAAELLQRMPPADAGKVMGQMKPEIAADIAAEIASRQPGVGVKK